MVYDIAIPALKHTLKHEICGKEMPLEVGMRAEDCGHAILKEVAKDAQSAIHQDLCQHGIYQYLTHLLLFLLNNYICKIRSRTMRIQHGSHKEIHPAQGAWDSLDESSRYSRGSWAQGHTWLTEDHRGSKCDLALRCHGGF